MEDKKEYKNIYVYLLILEKKNEEAETNYQSSCLPTREDGKG